MLRRASAVAHVESEGLAKCVVPYVEDRICEGEVAISLAFTLRHRTGRRPQVLTTAPMT